MARKRTSSPSGTLVVLEHASRVLADNPLGDPHVRKLAVWLPPQYDEGATRGRGRRFPVLYDLVGFTGSGHRAHQLEALRRQRAGARRAPHPRAEDGAGDLRVSRLLHVARRQPVRELVGDRRLRRLPDAGDHPVRRSRVPHARLARASRLLRQVVRRLRRDHPRHEVRAALGRHRRPLGRRLLRLRLPPRLAEHAERAREVPRAEARARAPTTRWPRPARARASRAGCDDGRVQALSRRGLEEGEAVAGRGARDHERLHGGDLRSRPEGAARLPAAVPPRDRRAARRALEELAAARPDPPRRQARGEPAHAQGHLHRLRLARPVPHPLRHAASCRCGSPKPAFATRTRNSTTIIRTSTTGWT